MKAEDNGSSRRERRHFSAAQKVAMVKRHLVDGVPVSDLCDEYQILPTQFYQWQRQLFEGGAAAFERKGAPAGPSPVERRGASGAAAGDQERGDRRADGRERPLKKSEWPRLTGRWVEPDVRDEVVDYVRAKSARTELPAKQLVKWLEIGMSKFYEWRHRHGKVDEHAALVPCDHWLEAWEKAAIVAFQAAHPREGYRRLTYMMLDAEQVAASPATVYRVLKEAGCFQRWNQADSRKGSGFVQPLAPHEHWHVDISYVNVCGTFYYLISALDGASRYLVHWELRESMKESDVEVVLSWGAENGSSPKLVNRFDGFGVGIGRTNSISRHAWQAPIVRRCHANTLSSALS